MSIFTPPTDNLYKFLALSGIVLIVAFIVPLLFFYQVGMEYLEHLRGSNELKVHEEFVNKRLDTLNVRKQQAEDEKNKLQQRLDGWNATSNSIEVEKLEGRIKEVNREIQSIADLSHDLTLNLELKRAQVKSEDTVSFNRRRDSRAFLYIGVFGVVLGFLVSPVGFFLWYKKLQRHQDRVAAKEAEDKVSPAAPNKQIEQPQSHPPTPINVPEPTK